MRTLITFLFLLCAALINAQNLDNRNCGSIPPASYWDMIDGIDTNLRWHYPNPENLKYVPLKIFAVANNDGSGIVNNTRILNMLCELNSRYDSTNIRFYMIEPPQPIYNSVYYTITDQSVADQMMLGYNRNDVCNLYICDISALGLCGYAYFPGTGPGPNSRAKGGIVLSTGCVEGTTLTHEMGHYLALPHPFDGTSGFPTSPGSELVTRNPNDTTNGRRRANCGTAGDRFCDTEADFIGNRWPCPYRGSQRDFNGDLFRPDQTLYMSYSSDACQNRFSTQQVSTMRYTLDNFRANFLVWPTPMEPKKGPMSSVGVYPPSGTVNIPRNFARFRWTSTPNATQYLLQLSSSVSFTNPVFETVVNDTTYLYTGWRLTEGRTYFWRVRPFNPNDYCGSFSSYSDFVAIRGYGIGSQELDQEQSWTVYPNPSNVGNLTIGFSGMGSKNVRVLDGYGKLVREVLVRAGQTELMLEDFSSGVYLVEVIENGKVSRKKWLNL